MSKTEQSNELHPVLGVITSDEITSIDKRIEEFLGRYQSIRTFMPTADGNEKEITLMYSVEEEWIDEIIYNENELTAEDIDILQEDGLLVKLVVSGIHCKLLKEGYRNPERVVSKYGRFEKDRSEYLKYG